MDQIEHFMMILKDWVEEMQEPDANDNLVTLGDLNPV